MALRSITGIDFSVWGEDIWILLHRLKNGHGAVVQIDRLDVVPVECVAWHTAWTIRRDMKPWKYRRGGMCQLFWYKPSALWAAQKKEIVFSYHPLEASKPNNSWGLIAVICMPWNFFSFLSFHLKRRSPLLLWRCASLGDQGLDGVLLGSHNPGSYPCNVDRIDLLCNL